MLMVSRKQAGAAGRGLFGLHQIPNALSIFRMPAVFLGMERVWSIHAAEGRWSLFWVLFMTGAALTDRLDGFLAKRYGWQSRLGSYLDHVADKVVTLTLFGFLVGLIGFPAWALAVILFREWFVTFLRTLGNRVRINVATSQAGRVKTFYQQLGSLFIFWDAVQPDGPLGFGPAQWLVWFGLGGLGLALLTSGRIRANLAHRFRVQGPEGPSNLDLYGMGVSFLLLAVPLRYSGPALVALVTLATGGTYLYQFLLSWRAAVSERIPKGSLAGITLAALVLGVGPAFVLKGVGATLGASMVVVLVLSLLWVVALVVNYRTSDWRAA